MSTQFGFDTRLFLSRCTETGSLDGGPSCSPNDMSTYEAGGIALLLQDSCKRGFILGESARSPVPLEGAVPVMGFHAWGAEQTASAHSHMAMAGLVTRGGTWPTPGDSSPCLGMLWVVTVVAGVMLASGRGKTPECPGCTGHRESHLLQSQQC